MDDRRFKNTTKTNIKNYEMLLGKFVDYCIENQVVDGKIILLEHMRNDNEVIVKMDILSPITVNMWGANINRETMDNIKKAGLIIEQKEDLFYSLLEN